ncbi:MAG: hypothetical protein HFI47_13575 [Lachnospiraceae bacterium]|nr:hypothetical protein [Lachnospiraceae bacterium]
MQKAENRGQSTALTSGNIKKAGFGIFCLGWCVASAIVVLRYKGNKWQSKAVVKIDGGVK